MTETLFTNIISGKIPCYKIYEDEHTFAFLDIHPVQPGHILVVPKEPIEFVWDLPEDLYSKLMLSAKKIAQHMRNSVEAPYIHQRIVGTDVPHAHIHLIPFSKTSELSGKQDFDQEPDQEALSAMQEKLKLF